MPGPSGRRDRNAPRPGGSSSRTRSTTRSARSCSRGSPRRGRRSRRPRDRGRPGRRSEGRSTRSSRRSSAGKAEGGTVAAGGERADDEGYLIAPTVFENVADDAFLSCEEVFGPVTSLYRFSTLDEALERANAVEFGLSAAIFTRDLHATQRFANELQAGHPARQLADRRRRRARPVRRSQGLRLGPARAGTRSDASSTPRRSPSTRTPRLAERVLVTGVLGCLGAWVSRVRRSTTATTSSATTSATTRSRLELVPRRRRRRASSSSRATSPTSPRSSASLDEHEITRVVHLAALQVPFVRANPPLGDARQRRRHGQRLRRRLAAARADPRRRRMRARPPSTTPADPSPAPESGGSRPATLYGVSKLANEGIARVYRAERGVPSIGLRPYVVYGPGPRPGDDVGADAWRCSPQSRGEPFRDRLLGRRAVRLRPGRRARARHGGARRDRDGAAVYNVPGARRRRGGRGRLHRRHCRAGRSRSPGAATAPVPGGARGGRLRP